MMGRAGKTKTSGRSRKLWWTLASIVGLALVIYGVAAVSSPKESADKPPKLTPADRSADFYTQALIAADSNETTRALELLAKSLALNPDNTSAKTLLDRVKQAAKEPTPTPAPKPGVDPFLSAVSDLRLLLPKTVPGYVLGTVISQGGDAVVSGEPAPGSPDVRTVSRVLLAVHDRGTPAAAAAFITSVSKKTYPNAASSVEIDGVMAYAGTDGGRLVSVSFVRGRYAFEAVVTSRSGDPAGLVDIAAGIARAFPDSF
ncbi:MAG: hypothetical protein Q8K99_06860 [Actinomycetota bacterium]|nr:hypothetical protein [Actinomycetota bacterium]